MLQCRTHRLYSSGTQTGSESAPPRRRRTRSPPTTNQGTRAGGPKKHQHTSTERACVRWGSLFWRHTLMRSSVAARVVKRGRMLIDEEREEMRSEARSLRRARRTEKRRCCGGSGRAANERRIGGVARAAFERGHRHAGRDSREGTRAPQRSDGARGDGDRAPPRQAARASRGGTATAGVGSPGRAVLGW